MPCVKLKGSFRPGQTVAALLSDDDRRSVPVNVTVLSDRQLRIGSADVRAILGRHGCNGQTVINVSECRMTRAAQARRELVGRATSLAIQLRGALAKLDDQGEAHALRNALTAWLADVES